MAQLVQVEAYLGPNKPEALAEAVIGIPDDKDHRDYHYAVIRQDRLTDKTYLVDLCETEGEALASVQSVTSHRGFGVLCNARVALVAELETETFSVS